MDDNAKQASSYQLDQEILDARGINMTVEEVAGLTTCRYAERVQKLHLNSEDMAFLKGLRRRIKNRMASQNSRRRSMEHLRRLTKELRTAQMARDSVNHDRRELTARRDHIRDKCAQLRVHVAKVLAERSDPTEIPSIDVKITQLPIESQKPQKGKQYATKKETTKKIAAETKTPLVSEGFTNTEVKIERDKPIFECRIDKLVQQSVNHLFDERKEKKVFAKTVFIDKFPSHNLNIVNDMKTDMNRSHSEWIGNSKRLNSNEEVPNVLNLSIRQEEKRKSHGRKQSAPRRITYVFVDEEDEVLDLKIKKEPQ